jgi:hypothetical protein
MATGSVVIFEEENNEAGNKERKWEKKCFFGIHTGMSLCHWSTVPVAGDVNLCPSPAIRCPVITHQTSSFAGIPEKLPITPTKDIKEK